MKQLIVLLATIILGLGIAAVVIGLGDNADKISDGTVNSIESFFTDEGGISLED